MSVSLIWNWYCGACGEGPRGYDNYASCTCDRKRCTDCINIIEGSDPSGGFNEELSNHHNNSHGWGGTATLGLLSVAVGAGLDAGKYGWSWSTYCFNDCSGTNPPCPNNTYEEPLCAHNSLVDVAVFGAATIGLWHMSPNDAIRERLLFGGITSALAIGFGTGKDVQDTVLSIMPWTILLSFAAGAATGMLLKRMKRVREEQVCTNHREKGSISLPQGAL